MIKRFYAKNINIALDHIIKIEKWSHYDTIFIVTPLKSYKISFLLHADEFVKIIHQYIKTQKKS